MTNNGDDPLSTGGAFGVLAGLDKDASDPILGRTLGDYEILDLIAAGGMGRVYRARRADGSFEREVAVKVSAGSGVSEELSSRFAQEQSVLAGLNHPNICQLFDAQVTDEGWPYIVMELVDGASIVDYCEKNAVGIRERLRLLVNVIDAVAYAHAQLVVHRDIKPANVLVSESGQVKLLDFGIAKLLESDKALTQATPLTPRYASPEQLLGHSITVASDIAQLGLLIYEVLTGEALNPSETLADAIQRAADGRSLRVELERAQELPREVLPIIEQCLRAEPNDRYADANSLKADIKAYLDGYPVVAVGQSAGYRFRKFIGRNLPATIIAVAAVVAIFGSTAWYTIQVTEQRDEAQRQTRLAEESLEFLAGMFEASDPDIAQDHELSAIDVLDLGAERIEKELADQAEIQMKLYFTVGKTYWRLGQLEKAEKAVRKLDDINEELYGTDIGPRFDALNLLANIVANQGDTESATRMQEELAQYSEQQLGPSHIKTLKVKNNLAISYWTAGKLDDAQALYEDVFARKVETLGPQEESTLTTAINLSQLYISLGEPERSVEFTADNLAVAEVSLGGVHPVTIDLVNNLASGIYFAEGASASIPYYEDALRRTEEVYGRDSFNAARRKAMIGANLADAGEVERGEEMQREALQTLIALRGPDDGWVLQARSNYATTMGLMGRYDEAMKMALDIIAAQSRVHGPSHPSTMYSRIVLGEAMVNTGDPEAEVYVRSLAAEIVASFGKDHYLYETISPVLEQL